MFFGVTGLNRSVHGKGTELGKMMAPEPLRSAMTFGGVEDTSLALPSDNKLHSGQQRVLDQVHTIKRSKSKPGKNGSLSPSPTSMGNGLMNICIL